MLIYIHTIEIIQIKILMETNYKDNDGNTNAEYQEYISDSDVVPTLHGAEADSPLKGKGKQAVRAEVAAQKAKPEPEEVTLSWSDSNEGNDSIGT
jgi:hypothetical protein